MSVKEYPSTPLENLAFSCPLVELSPSSFVVHEIIGGIQTWIPLVLAAFSSILSIPLLGQA
jgi:hypothetical protein